MQVVPSNIFAIVKRLLVHLSSQMLDTLNPISEECHERTLISQRIIECCSKDNYANINNFEWFFILTLGLSIANQGTFQSLLI
jgi:hypothetical protein